MEPTEKAENQIRQRLAGAGAVVVCWTFQALLFAPQTYLINLRSPFPLTWWQAVQANLILFYIWAALTPFVLWTGRKFPFERRHLARNSAIHFVLSFVVAFTHIFILQTVNTLTLSWIEIYEPPLPVTALIVGLGATNVINYWGIVGVSQALTFFRRYREREVSLARAQLQAVQTQLHPHFLFNTLNAISELVHEDADRAEKTITQLSDLLRISLQSDAEQEITFKEELDFLHKYIEIQQILLQERLIVLWKIAPETLDALIPNMLLQPIIENAIRHGIAPKASGGTIEIASSRRAGQLGILVKDNGVGFPAETEVKEGIGLKSIRTRLQHLYGEAHRFLLEKPPQETGLVVEIIIPFREARAQINKRKI